MCVHLASDERLLNVRVSKIKSKVTVKEILHLYYMLCIQQCKEVIVPPIRPEPVHYSVMFATL